MVSTQAQAVAAHIEQRRSAYQEALCEWLRIPSISAVSRHAQDVRGAAEWLAKRFREAGLEVEMVATEGFPLLVAQSPPVPGRPVALVYGHYDVQPPEPLELWESPPFEPRVRNGNVYARGATDDKGQLLTHVNAVQSWLESQGQLPIQVKFLVEGEEEVGSQSLQHYLAQDSARERLACDVVVISDSCQFGPGVPAITYGLRGIAYFELFLRGPAHDLHSGTFGGGVTNPANALCQLLGSLVGADGRIAIAGFYDSVKPLAQAERDSLASLPFDESAYYERLGVSGAAGEEGYTILERRWARPSFDVHGLTSGYQGEGSKTVLPAEARAKFSFRLVPDQDPDEVRRQLEAHLAERLPPGIQMELRDLHGSPGVVTALDSPPMRAAQQALREAFGKDPVFIREGGSIPIVSEFSNRLGVATLLVGWGQDDDNMHAPNEKFSLESYHRGTLASAYLWDALSELGSANPQP